MTNEQRGIIKLCIKNGACSADFSKHLEISVPTATKIITGLVEEGYLQDCGKVGTSGGRRPSTFGLILMWVAL